MSSPSCLSRSFRQHNLFVVSCRPDLVDMERVQIQSGRENLEQAFEIAERLGVTRLLDAEGEGEGSEAKGVGSGLWRGLT